jgi:hypothetical protein
MARRATIDTDPLSVEEGRQADKTLMEARWVNNGNRRDFIRAIYACPVLAKESPGFAVATKTGPILFCRRPGFGETRNGLSSFLLRDRSAFGDLGTPRTSYERSFRPGK